MEVCIFYNKQEHLETTFSTSQRPRISVSYNIWKLKSLHFEEMELESQISFNSSSSMENEDDHMLLNKPIGLPYCKKMSEYESNDHSLIMSILPYSQSVNNLSDIERNLAATKLQKVYKSFRTRRQLADCAVLVEQKWYYCKLTSSWFFFFLSHD